MNKGEWSEFYAFLKLLGDGVLYGADESLSPVQDLCYPIQKILRHNDSEELLSFTILRERGLIKIEPQNLNISSDDFIQSARVLFHQMKSEGSFSDSKIGSFINRIGSPKIKENNKSKRDISVTLHDIQVGRDLNFGFSIKSDMGGSSTLFNANPTTNIIYKIEGIKNLSADKISELNNLKIQKLVCSLYDSGGSLVFQNYENIEFRSNLCLIDSRFDEILSSIILGYYSKEFFGLKDGQKLTTLTEWVTKNNPLGMLKISEYFYSYKVKQFLLACALGMTASTPWSGHYDVDGGYLIVKEDGSLVCYHIYNWNAFQNYLFSHTFIDTPSTSRHQFGKIYESNGDYFIKLNFQIRFNLSSKVV